LVGAHLDVVAPVGVRVVQVETALELRAAVLAEADAADLVVMAAAVADFRPAQVQGSKIKKSEHSDDAPVLALVRNPDILAELVARRAARPSSDVRAGGQVIVGFAAETGDADHDVLSFARAKLARKGCDLLVVNDVSGGAVFGRTTNQVTVLGAGGVVVARAGGDKDQVAAAICDMVRPLIERQPSG
jgi:phosphopantothenoylcysteine decarboxylase/phosphopantothenate--cysteine ligase